MKRKGGSLRTENKKKTSSHKTVKRLAISKAFKEAREARRGGKK
jgi:hypothetical protein